MLLSAAAALCLNANAQAVRSQQSRHVEKHEQAVKVDEKKHAEQRAVEHKGDVKKNNKSHKGSMRTTTTVKLRKKAANNTHSVKDKRGNNVVIPEGASITYLGSKGNYYKVRYKGYTGYVAKKYTTGYAR